ncbi:MULE domain-containing protein [Aphis craccivora]|uniref:MULE domain-containing protein n=1 Tax=Aphis craccivora TaxID=307492 RepID=A0A6G0YP71_APHCR|nr:MULE domain-containing protein [Aphis craccivora]
MVTKFCLLLVHLKIFPKCFTSYLQFTMNDLNLILLPKIIYADFELVIHSALLIVFPNAIRKGYRFHLGQKIGIRLCFINEIMTIQPNVDLMADSLFPTSIWSESDGMQFRNSNICPPISNHSFP